MNYQKWIVFKNLQRLLTQLVSLQLLLKGNLTKHLQVNLNE